MEESWTIVELAELAAEALAAPAPNVSYGAAEVGAARGNGRVRDVPNERLIRWYGTVGLVDPPMSRRGRIARYGRRHLLQLVAVKRRQAQGRSLAEIQAELAGATDETLAAVARVPATAPGPGPVPVPGPVQGPVPAAVPVAGRAPERFWTRQARAAAAEPPPVTAVQDGDGAGLPGAAVASARIVHGIRLAPGVMLLLDGADRQPGRDDLTAITNAARPLLSELASRGLGASGPHHPAEVEHPPKGTGYEQ